MKIDTIWLAVTVNPETGDEALCAALYDGETHPLFALRPEHVEAMTEQAESIAVNHGIDIRIIKLTARTDEGFISGKARMAMKIKWPETSKKDS